MTADDIDRAWLTDIVVDALDDTQPISRAELVKALSECRPTTRKMKAVVITKEAKR